MKEKKYLQKEAIIAMAINFIVSGVIVVLIHYKADTVATDTFSIAIDLMLTCLIMFILTAFMCRARLERSQKTGILETESRVLRFLSRLYRYPVLFGALTGLAATAVLFALTAPLLALLGISALPFGVYVPIKCVFAALLGGGFTVVCLYAGMCKSVK